MLIFTDPTYFKLITSFTLSSQWQVNYLKPDYIFLIYCTLNTSVAYILAKNNKTFTACANLTYILQ